jgi:tetratricopeptide (TPR) repeat protein
LLARRERMREAEAAYLPIIARARLLLGPDDPALYNALNDLGVALMTLDRNDEAIAVLEEALAGRRRLLGVNGPLVVTTLGNLAYARDAKGDSAGSLELMREALALVEASPEKPRAIQLGLYNNIGATLQDLDRNEEAAPYLRRAAEIAGETLGPDHPDTLAIQGNLAGLESDLGETERAMETFLHVIERRTALLGSTAASTLTARYGYWNAMWKARRFDEASAGFAELLTDVNVGLGEDHWLSAQTSMSLARALLDAGRVNEALPYAERAHARLLALFGADHPRTITAKQVMDDIHGRDGERTAESASAVQVAGEH